MAKKNTARRASTPWLKKVKTRDGREVINECYDPKAKAPKRGAKKESDASNVLASVDTSTEETEKQDNGTDRPTPRNLARSIKEELAETHPDYPVEYEVNGDSIELYDVEGRYSAEVEPIDDDLYKTTVFDADGDIVDIKDGYEASEVADSYVDAIRLDNSTGWETPNDFLDSMEEEGGLYGDKPYERVDKDAYSMRFGDMEGTSEIGIAVVDKNADWELTPEMTVSKRLVDEDGAFGNGEYREYKVKSSEAIKFAQKLSETDGFPD